MNKLKVIIVDDEAAARRGLTVLINQFVQEVEVLGAAESADEAYDLILKLKPDLILLDVEMPYATGFELLKRFERIDFQVIFTTAYNQYAIQAIKFSALDYLLKPINPSELELAFTRARAVKGGITETARQMELLLANISQLKSKKIMLPCDEGFEVVLIDEIIRCEGDRNYTWIFLKGGQKYLICKTLKEYENILGDSGFMRVFQSHLINLNCIKKYIKGRGGSLILDDETIVPVSRDKKRELLERMKAV